LKKLKWDEIDFGMDKKINMQAFCLGVFKHIRKVRNLYEMLSDFEDAYRNQSKPKRPKSVYMLFTEKHYHDTREKMPNLSSTEIMKHLSQMYKEIDEDELEELKKISIEHKERYMSDIRNFKYVTFS
jgi:hypothetical protein